MAKPVKFSSTAPDGQTTATRGTQTGKAFLYCVWVRDTPAGLVQLLTWRRSDGISYVKFLQSQVDATEPQSADRAEKQAALDKATAKLAEVTEALEACLANPEGGQPSQWRAESWQSRQDLAIKERGRWRKETTKGLPEPFNGMARYEAKDMDAVQVTR